jgi:small conductance mechanosensitive channel
MWKRVFSGQAEWTSVLAALAVVAALAYLGARLARRITAAAMAGVLGDSLLKQSPLVRGPLRLVSSAAFVLIFAVLLFPALELIGLQPRTGLHLRELSTWSYEKGLPLLATIVVCYALVRITGLLVTRFEHELNRGTSLDALERAKRAKTLGSVINKVVTIALSSVALLMVLTAFGLNIAPVLTGAGILGLAVGFGAQTLVRDVISGFFLILEDQVRVGDVAAINGTGGLVEAINLRTIVLRDAEGTVHVFPNGAIQTLANRSKDFSYYVIDLGISYREDPDRVADLLRQIGAEMQADQKYAPFILEPVEILGVDSFGDWSMVLKMRIKTVPLKQWEVGREFRKRLRRRFEQEGIEVPFPERVVKVRDDHDKPRDGDKSQPAAVSG